MAFRGASGEAMRNQGKNAACTFRFAKKLNNYSATD
jgi:hypothetical protein